LTAFFAKLNCLSGAPKEMVGDLMMGSDGEEWGRQSVADTETRVSFGLMPRSAPACVGQDDGLNHHLGRSFDPAPPPGGGCNR
jgi:hypothetical protein